MYSTQLSRVDVELAKQHLDAFLPKEVYDIHVHPYDAAHFSPEAWPFLHGQSPLGCHAHREALQRYMNVETIHGLYFGMPHRSADRERMNNFVKEEVRNHGTTLSRSLKVVAPDDNRALVAEELRNGQYVGIKVYHIYSAREDSFNAAITEYAPEWMWEVLHDIRGVMMLHIVKNEGVADRENQRQISYLCAKYPNVTLILAHVARSFNYRNAREGLAFLQDVDNAVVDTSAITEAATFRYALKHLGAKRILWGSDFAVSEMRGRCVTTGAGFFWLHPEVIQPNYQPPTESNMTLVGIESLLTLKEACEEEGLLETDIADIFYHNAVRVLQPHLTKQSAHGESGQLMWDQAKTVISGGTGLLSKRAEMFDAETWPAYFSRCSGCEVWDLDGKRYIDFAGGIGAVLLGYNDPDVTKAVIRRLSLGTYCSLLSPDEVALAAQLLELHPWAGKVRYARGGGEAMAMAVRIARAASGRSGVAFCGYHGWHDWYLAANLGDTDALDGHLLPGLAPKGVPKELRGTSVPFLYNRLDAFHAAVEKLGSNFGVVVMEPMRSQEPEPGFLEEIKAVCHRRGAVLVLDEVTGGLRYGFPGAHARLGITPDIAVYAKAMGNGVPFAAIIGSQEVMAKADDSFISSSYWTDGIGPAAALATIRKAKAAQVFEKVWQAGEKFKQQLHQLAINYPACRITIGGVAASPTLTFQLDEASVAARTFYVRAMCELGFLVSSTYYLMYAHQTHHIEQLLQALEAVFSELEKAIKSGTLLLNNTTGAVQQGFARLA